MRESYKVTKRLCYISIKINWLNAIQKEIKSLYENHTIDLVKLSNEKIT